MGSNFTSGLDVTGGNINLGARTDATPHTFASGCSCLINSAAGTFGSDTSVDAAFSSVVYNGKVYVGTKETDNAAVYRYDGGTTWTRVSDSTPGKIITGDTDNVDAIVMTVYNGKIYAGTQTANNTGAIYSYDGSSWSLVQTTRGTFGTSNVEINVDGVSSLTVWNGRVYAFTQETDNAAVYRYDGNSATWVDITSIGGKLVTADAGDIDEGVLIVYNGHLWAGTRTGAATATISRYDGFTWQAAETPNGDFGGGSGYYSVDSMAVYDGQLFAGVAGSSNNAKIVMWKGGITQPASNEVQFVNTTQTLGKIDATDATDVDAVTSLVVYQGRLYAGTSTGTTTGAVYEYSGLSDTTNNPWTKVNTTRGTFGAQTTVTAVRTMIEYNNTLYVGTELSNAGGMYTYTKYKNNSYGLQFTSDAAATNIATISFQGTQQVIGNGNNTGSFLFTHGIATTAGAYDLAEDYPTRDDSIVAGDIVSIDPDEQTFVRKGSSELKDLIVGVYSTDPALRLSQKDATINGARAVPVALAGRVPVKVSTENGPIHAGDPITISTTHPGVGVKAVTSGRIVGMSMGNYSGDGIGQVVVFVNPSFYTPSIGDVLQGSQLVVNGESVLNGDVRVFGALNVTGSISTDTLVVRGNATVQELFVTGSATIDGALKVSGNVEVAQLTVNGKIITQGSTPTAVLGATTGEGATASINGNDTAGTIEYVTGTDSLPLHPLTAGEQVEVDFVNDYSQAPRVAITPKDAGSASIRYYVTATTTGFTVHFVDQPTALQNYSFDYIVIQ
jgi:hypothetical protein